MKLKIGPPSEDAIDSRFLKHDAADPARPDRVRGDVDAGKKSRSTVGNHGRGKHADGGRFSGAVRTDEAEDLSPVDIEARVPHRVYAAGKPLSKSAHDYRLLRDRADCVSVRGSSVKFL